MGAIVEKDDKDWAFYINERGEEESIHLPTGEVAKCTISKDDLDRFVKVSTPEGIRWFPKESSHLIDKEKPFSLLLADQIISLVAEGKTIQKAAQMSGISYVTLCKWRRLYPEFKLLVEQAKQDRGEIIFEKMLEVAEDTEAQRDEVALGKLKADIYQHVSAVENDKFNLKQKVAQDVRVGIVAVETGIRRPGDAGYEEKEIFGEIEKGQSATLEHVQPAKKLIDVGGE